MKTTFAHTSHFSLVFIKRFFLNGPTTASFVYFRSFLQQFKEKIVGFRGIWTEIVGIEGKHADHLTTTTTEPVGELFGRDFCFRILDDGFWDQYYKL